MEIDNELIDYDIMNKVICKFNFPEDMMIQIYNEVVKLNKNTKCVYECLRIIEHKILDDEIKFIKMRNEFIKSM